MGKKRKREQVEREIKKWATGKGKNERKRFDKQRRIGRKKERNKESEPPERRERRKE